VFDGDLDHPAKVVVVMSAGSDVAGIDPVLRKRACTLLEFGEQYVAVVMEITDYWSVKSGIAHTRNYFGDARGCFSGVDSDPNDFGTRAGELDHLLCRSDGIRRIGVGHRLDDDSVTAADQDTTHVDGNGFATCDLGHSFLTQRRKGARAQGSRDNVASLRLVSFVAKGDQRIDSCSTTRRQIPRDSCDRKKHDRR
jgi:hypothetical protein